MSLSLLALLLHLVQQRRQQVMNKRKESRADTAINPSTRFHEQEEKGMVPAISVGEEIHYKILI